MRTAIEVEAEQIDGVVGLDPIQVFWSDLGAGKGSVTITCYGSAWTAYFNAMGPRTIRQFFGDADTDYLVTKLANTQRKAALTYLGRIIDAIKREA